MSFSDLLKSAKAAERESRTVQVTVGGELVSITVSELPGLDWATITAKYPPRVDSPADRGVGFNAHAVSVDAAKVNGVVEFDGEETRPSDEDWDDLFASLGGHDFNQVCDAVFYLNEWLPRQRVTAAKKALKGSSKKS